eukprot:888418_1
MAPSDYQILTRTCPPSKFRSSSQQIQQSAIKTHNGKKFQSRCAISTYSAQNQSTQSNARSVARGIDVVYKYMVISYNRICYDDLPSTTNAMALQWHCNPSKAWSTSSITQEQVCE